jgi:hypothetical protein
VLVPELISGRLPPRGIWRGMSVPIIRSCRSPRAELGLLVLTAGRFAASLEALREAHKYYARRLAMAGTKTWVCARTNAHAYTRNGAQLPGLQAGGRYGGWGTGARLRNWPSAVALQMEGAGAAAALAVPARAAFSSPNLPPPNTKFRNCQRRRTFDLQLLVSQTFLRFSQRTFWFLLIYLALSLNPVP